MNDVIGTQKVIQLILDCGEEVLITPLSIYVRRKLGERSRDLFPYPDEKEFERPVDPEVSLFDDQVVPAKMDKDYLRLKALAEAERSNWVSEQVIQLTCKFPAGEKELIAKYASQRETLSRIIDMPEDRWEATLFYCLLSDSDKVNILNAAASNLELTEGEVQEGLHYFQPKARRGGHNGSHKA